MAYLSSGWKGKKVEVYFNVGGAFAGTLLDTNDGGLKLEVGADQEDEERRVLFVPWSSVKFVEALEDLDKSRTRVVAKPPGF